MDGIIELGIGDGATVAEFILFGLEPDTEGGEGSPPLVPGGHLLATLGAGA